MGLREALDKNKTATTVVAAVLIVAAIAFIIYQQLPTHPVSRTKAYFTFDDGATTFVDDVTNIPPFQKDGKTAVGVEMFTCDNGATGFPGYLQRYTPEAKAILEKAVVEKGGPGAARDELPFSQPAVSLKGLELKPLGAGGRWVNMGGQQAYQLTRGVKCPDGATGELDTMLP